MRLPVLPLAVTTMVAVANAYALVLATTQGPDVGALRAAPGEAAALVDKARRRSPTVARLLRSLNESNLVLYIELHRELPGGVGQMTLLTAAGGVRRVRIALDAHLGTRDHIVVLGHELHHATELAAAPAVQNEATLKAFYQRVGFQLGRKCGIRFDTAEARRTAWSIAHEVDTLRGTEGAW
ncbi:MAG: hypothetical protein JJE40_13540 [Vicinamibacteria bacterium]|nr:hypothetical protein [Vicinamibacteria bacterium]